MQIRHLLVAVPLTLLTACATTAERQADTTNVKIGQTVNVDGPLIRIVEVIEDSRCPAKVQCAWPGQVRIVGKWVRANGDKDFELSSMAPVAIADGMLSLKDVQPIRTTSDSIAPEDYRFSLKFDGGL